METDLKLRLARLTSNILNPFLVSFLVITLLSYQATSSILQALKWSFISAGLSILPVLAVIVHLLRNGRLGSFFINARRERNKIYLLATVCTVTSLGILYRLGAPSVLIAAYLAGVLSIVVFMFINFIWKISVHTAFISGSITVLIIVYGTPGIAMAFLVPLTGWSRIKLDRHSPAQVATGAFLAALIAFIVFHSSGLLSAAHI